MFHVVEVSWGQDSFNFNLENTYKQLVKYQSSCQLIWSINRLILAALGKNTFGHFVNLWGTNVDFDLIPVPRVYLLTWLQINSFFGEV